MTDFIAPSGARIVINFAPWKNAKMLKNAIERELARGKGYDLATALMVDSSEEVDAALWPCLIRCTRNDEKIVETTFDSAEARKDYYDIIEACVKENLRPLAESLISKLTALGILIPLKQANADQKSPSETSVTS